MYKPKPNYDMPSALKTKLRLAKRNFSSNKPSYSSISVEAPPPYYFKKESPPMPSKREIITNATSMNQRLAEIERNLNMARQTAMTRERQILRQEENKSNPAEYLESELRTAHRINFIDQVLNEATRMV